MHETLVKFRIEASKEGITNILEKLDQHSGMTLWNRHVFFALKGVAIIPVEPLKFKFVFARENKKLEKHTEID